MESYVGQKWECTLEIASPIGKCFKIYVIWILKIKLHQ